jgi:hypothetical protein
MVSIRPLACVSYCVKLYSDRSGLTRRSNGPFTSLSSRFEGVTTGGNAKFLYKIVLAGANPLVPGRSLPVNGGTTSTGQEARYQDSP